MGYYLKVFTFQPINLMASITSSLAAGVSRLPSSVLDMRGQTSPLQRHLLSNLCHQVSLWGGNCSYLEVGVLYGATLIAASYRNKGDYVGIDNFTGDVRDEAQRNLQNSRGVKATIIEADIDTFDTSQLTIPVNVFFHDANKDSGLFARSLYRLQDKLADPFILIADNWSFSDVRLDVSNAITKRGWSVYGNVSLMSKDCDIRGWWNGWNLMVIQKKPELYESLAKLTPLNSLGAPVGSNVPLHDIRKRNEQKLYTIADYES